MREIMTKQKKETSMKRNNLIKKFFVSDFTDYHGGNVDPVYLDAVRFH